AKDSPPLRIPAELPARNDHFTGRIRGAEDGRAVSDQLSQPGSPPAARVKDFFISYTGADRGWAEWIAWHLEEKSYTTILQAWDFGAGSNFVVAMHRASIQAQRTLLVVSERSLASGYVEAEWAARFAQDATGEARRLLPVRIEVCDIGG